MSTAKIIDIKGLVTTGKNLEEILKNRDLISEHGGLLTISEFARIVFDDGGEVEIFGPVSFTLDSSFFQLNRFDPQLTQINNHENLDLVSNIVLERNNFSNNSDEVDINTINNVNLTAQQLNTNLNNNKVNLDLENKVADKNNELIPTLDTTNFQLDDETTAQ